MATTLPQAKGGEAGQLPPLSTNPPPHKAPWNVRQVICAISSSSQLCPGKLPRSVGLPLGGQWSLQPSSWPVPWGCPQDCAERTTGHLAFGMGGRVWTSPRWPECLSSPLHTHCHSNLRAGPFHLGKLRLCLMQSATLPLMPTARHL